MTTPALFPTPIRRSARPLAPALAVLALALALAAAACGPAAEAQPGPAPVVDVHGHDAEALAAVRARVHAGDARYAAAYRQLLGEADTLLAHRFATVMDKPVPAPSGDMHDYYSTAPYWWPDSTKPDGLPYVRRDGRRNPESQLLDESAFDGLLHGVPALAWAWYFSGDDRYAEKAGAVVRAWFVDAATRMNPHLRHAQAVPGHADGRKYGIIEAQHFYEVVDALAVLKASDALDADAWAAVDAWFADYLAWLRESDFGRAEAATLNNHATAYDAQVAAVALYLGRDDVAREVLAALPARRIDAQVAPDGRQPEELARTRSFGYSVYNLYHLVNAATLARHVDVDLFGYASADGRSLRAALDYVVPAAGRRDAWPHPQLDGTWRGAEERLAQVLRRAAVAYEDPRYEAARERLAGTNRTARYVLVHPYSE